MKKIVFLLLFCVSFAYSQDKNWDYFINRYNIEIHANKKFVFSGDVKASTLSKDGGACLYTQISGTDKKRLFFDNMLDRPITKDSWDLYSIEGILDADAKFIQVGGIVTGQGIFYFDNFQLKVQEKNGTWTIIPIENSNFDQPITDQNNLGWIRDKNNLNYVYSSVPRVSNKNSADYSLLVKSIYDIDEKPVSAKSIKLNPKGEAVLIENINVIDVNTGKTKKRSVLIRDKKIVEIARNIQVSDATVVKIDGTGKWLIPGMIDSHIHLFQSGSLYTRPDAFDLRKYRPYEEERKWLRQNAPDVLKRYLQSGITTVIDVGGPLYNYEIRDRYSDNTSFPNIYLTGPLISTYQPKAFDIEDSPIIKANSPEEAIELVRAQLPYKPDFIKIWYINSGDATLNHEIVKATIAESHKHNLKVAVHATNLKTAKLAIKAEADILVHSVSDAIDEEFVEMVTSKKIIYIPTLIVSDKYTEAFTQEIAFSNEELRLSNPFPIKSFSDHKHLNNDAQFERSKTRSFARRKRDFQQNDIEAANLKLLQDNNALIATGTDAGNIGTLHGTSYQEELQTMQEAGLSNLQILQASTISAAKILDKESEIGSIEVSKLADVLILDENPLEDIQALQKIQYVIKGGSVFRTEDVLIESPENVVQRQVNAYNLRNLDAFLENFSEDIEIYYFPNTLDIKGKEAYRKIFSNYFKKFPDLHCEILNRTVLGNTIIDHERVLRVKGGNYTEVIAIYKIENEKIAKVYFIKD
ncbi:amidohydrolase family protein [Kordia sp. YSTF-M3]|uniref:Amidohydrolase family protein n=1 Tax=Kordia aestuariivivens TaxID=2759037 RepID=A0ABR7QAS4_9FLAO|nr:amidohydrolase family protein [Kordia aestuariivivens]MBC8755670.1 amidohydrolase family protein [Kordia aestuariivivens]